MTRLQRILLVCCSAGMLAILALAPTAHAAQFKAGGYPATVSGTQSSPIVFDFEGRVITCSSASFVGSLTGPSSSLPVTPTFSNCTGTVAGITWPATVTKSNPCTFSLLSVKHMDLNCTLTLHLYNGSPHTPENALCSYHLGGQTTLKVLHFLQAFKGGWLKKAIRVGLTLKGLLGKSTKAFPICGSSELKANVSGSFDLFATSGGLPVDLVLE